MSEGMTALDVWLSGIGIGVVIGVIVTLLAAAGLKALGRALLLLATIVALTVPVAAQYRYTAFEQITVAAVSIGFTSATINEGSGHPQATIASCRLETAQIRYRVDGTAPTSSVGTLLEIGDIITLTSPDLVRNFRAIRTGGTSGVLDCSYFTP